MGRLRSLDGEGALRAANPNGITHTLSVTGRAVLWLLQRDKATGGILLPAPGSCKWGVQRQCLSHMTVT